MSGFDPPRVKGHCPNCGPNKWAQVVGYARQREDDEESQTWYQTEHRLLQCPACEAIYHQTVGVFSEDYEHVGSGEFGEEYTYSETIRHWPEVPQIKKDKPNWINELIGIDLNLCSLIEDVYAALNAGLSLFAVIGVRTIIDRATEVLSIQPTLSFAQKLDALVDKQYIGASERDMLAIAIDAGSAAAHRGWRPSDTELKLILDAVEAFLHRVFIMRKKVSGLKSVIPPKPKTQRVRNSKAANGTS